MSTYLPEDVLLRILSYLPPKSLIRFRCVSKTWLALIGNPDFFSKNLLNHSILTQNPNYPLPLILVKAKDKFHAGKQIYSSLSFGNLDCVSQLPLNLPESPDRRFFPTQTVYNDLKIVASCNGLLCLYHYYVGMEDIYLWNPVSSSGLKALPGVSHPSQPGLTVLTYSVGFGFDPRSKEFKVVRLLAFLSTTDSSVMDVTDKAEVYSLSDGSCRLLDLLVPLNIYSDSPTAALDGVFLWYYEYHHNDGATEEDETIFAFDFSEEVFRKTPFPDSSVFREYGGCTRTLTGLKGSIAMVVFPRAPRNTNFSLDVWVLLEFGVKESWTRLISIGLLLDLERPLGFWKNGELFMENSEGQLVLYDPYTQIKKNLQIEGVKGSLEVVHYMQSSVAINRAIEVEGEDNL